MLETLPICNATDTGEEAEDTTAKRRRKRFVRRLAAPRVKREQMTVCRTDAVFGVQFTYLNSWNFTLTPELCFCGVDNPAVEGHEYIPGDTTTLVNRIELETKVHPKVLMRNHREGPY